MTLYHINIHGEAAPCDAKIQCRAKGGPGAEHFEGDMEGAREWAEKRLEKIHYAPITLNKKSTPMASVPRRDESLVNTKKDYETSEIEPQQINMGNFDYSLVTADTSFKLEMSDDPLLKEGDSVKKIKKDLARAHKSNKYSPEQIQKLEAQTWAYELYFAQKKQEYNQKKFLEEQPKDRLWTSGLRKKDNAIKRQEQQQKILDDSQYVDEVRKRKPKHAKNEYQELLDMISESYKS